MTTTLTTATLTAATRSRQDAHAAATRAHHYPLQGPPAPTRAGGRGSLTALTVLAAAAALTFTGLHTPTDPDTAAAAAAPPVTAAPANAPPASSSPAGTSTPAQPIPSVPDAGILQVGADYAFLDTDPAGTPARWPCTPTGLSIALNPTGPVPGDAATQLAHAIATLSAVTGRALHLSPDPDRADITVAYTTATLDNSETVAGLTRTRISTSHVITHATITVRTGLDARAHQHVLLHELGHALGAAHAATPDALMAPTYSPTTSPTDSDTFTAGDQYALTTLGCPHP